MQAPAEPSLDILAMPTRHPPDKSALALEPCAVAAGQSVIIGDALQNVLAIEPESVRLTVTSPPYWNAKDYAVADQLGHGQELSGYLGYMQQLTQALYSCTQPNGKVALVLAAIPVSKEHGTDAMLVDSGRARLVDLPALVQTRFIEAGWELSNMFIWDKRRYNNQRIFGSYPYPPNLYSHIAFEQIHVFRKPGDPPRMSAEQKEQARLSMDEWREWCFDSIWDIAPVIKIGAGGHNSAQHEAPFPPELARRLIRLFSFPDDLILDPFVGSGTTLAVAAELGRRGLGIELDERHLSTIEERLLALSATEDRAVVAFDEAEEDFSEGDRSRSEGAPSE